MRIKFRCSSCEKPLSIGRRKAGATVTCPKCKSKIVVPSESESSSAEEDEENPFDEFQVFDDEFDEPELVYEDEQISSSSQTPKLNDRLSVPRKVVYFQGALLGIVAVLFFLLGLIVGSKNGSSGGGSKQTQSNVRGKILLSGNAADEGAVVFLLPTGNRPGTKFESEELIPGRTFTSANPEVPLIRKFGGNVCTTNQLGQFQMSVKPNREYLLLVVSANGVRNRELDSDFHSNMGHYFTSLDNLTEGRICYYKKVLPIKSNENLGEIIIPSNG